MQAKTNKKELHNRKTAFHEYRNAKKVNRGEKNQKHERKQLERNKLSLIAFQTQRNTIQS